MSRLSAWLRADWAADRGRWAYWMPVAMGAGIGLYFALKVEPYQWLGFIVSIALLSMAALAWRRQGLHTVLLLAVAAGLGFAAAQVRTVTVAGPVIDTRIGPVTISGRLRGVEALPTGQRLTLDRPVIADVAPAATPRRVRVTWRGDMTGIEPGDPVRLRAVLLPPPGPALPGGFDFQRQAFFLGLGAVGYAVGPPQPVPGATTRTAGFTAAVARLRAAASARIRERLPGATGAVAAALTTGDRRAIPEADIAAMQAAGLAHLLAISGLHIGLVSAFVFFAVRALLAAVPWLALRADIKKIAAGAALAAALLYMLISGATIPTQRAFIMAAIVLMGVLLDRLAVSLRLVAWAAALVLVLAPESLLSASFQMSFAAVVVLIAGYEALAGRIAEWRRQADTAAGRMGLYLGGVVLTTVLATAATAPFAVFHFNRLAAFGLLANVVAVPLAAFAVMPAAVLAFLLMPFGLEGWALAVMGWGIDVILWVARTLSAWPGATLLVSPLSLGGLIAATLGGLWLCLWQRRWRVLGLLPLGLGLVTPAFFDPPHVLITGDARLVGVALGSERELALSSTRRSRFAAEQWLRRAAQRSPLPWTDSGRVDDQLACDAVGCLYRRDGQVVALSRDPRGHEEDCRLATVIVSTEPVRVACAGPSVVIDWWSLWRDGSHAVWLGKGGVRVESANGARGERPWVPRRGRAFRD